MIYLQKVLEVFTILLWSLHAQGSSGISEVPAKNENPCTDSFTTDVVTGKKAISILPVEIMSFSGMPIHHDAVVLTAALDDPAVKYDETVRKAIETTRFDLLKQSVTPNFKETPTTEAIEPGHANDLASRINDSLDRLSININYVEEDNLGQLDLSDAKKHSLLELKNDLKTFLQSKDTAKHPKTERKSVDLASLLDETSLRFDQNHYPDSVQRTLTFVVSQENSSAGRKKLKIVGYYFFMIRSKIAPFSDVRSLETSLYWNTLSGISLNSQQPEFLSIGSKSL